MVNELAASATLNVAITSNKFAIVLSKVTVEVLDILLACRTSVPIKNLTLPEVLVSIAVFVVTSCIEMGISKFINSLVKLFVRVITDVANTIVPILISKVKVPGEPDVE